MIFSGSIANWPRSSSRVGRGRLLAIQTAMTSSWRPSPTGGGFWSAAIHRRFRATSGDESPHSADGGSRASNGEQRRGRGCFSFFFHFLYSSEDIAMVPSTLGRTALLLLLLVAAARTSAAVEYTITDLGTLGQSPTNLFGRDGHQRRGAGCRRGSGTYPSLFLWDPKTACGTSKSRVWLARYGIASTTRGRSPVRAIPTSGAFLWNSPTDIRQLLPGRLGRQLRHQRPGHRRRAGNHAGQPTQYLGVPWDAEGNPQLLAAPDLRRLRALDINNAGQIVG